MDAGVVREEKNNKTVAVIGTIVVHTLILLFLLVYYIITPLPPYKLIPAPEVEVEADFGNNINGTGNVEQDKMGTNPNPSDNSKAQSTPLTHQSAAPLSNDAEDPSIKVPHKSSKTARVDTMESPQPKVSVELANAMNKFSHSKGNPGGDGNSGQQGNAGNPNGTTPGESNGDGGNFKFFLKGRNLVSRPSITANTQDEGKVVVKILVDQNGVVIKATPGEKGSTTTSPVLYAKAKDAAMATKFNSSPDGTPEQQGTMTFIFVIQ
jgi:protein TonB